MWIHVIFNPGPVSVGRVQQAVCAAPSRCVSKGAGGHAHIPVPQRRAPAPPPFVQQPSPPAGEHRGGEEEEHQPRTH